MIAAVTSSLLALAWLTAFEPLSAVCHALTSCCCTGGATPLEAELTCSAHAPHAAQPLLLSERTQWAEGWMLRSCHAPHARHSSLLLMLHTMAASCRSASMSASSDLATESVAATGGTPAGFCTCTKTFLVGNVW